MTYDGKNRRRESRYDCAIAVELTVAGTRQHGTTVNISQGGALVMTVPYPSVNDLVVLHVRLPGVGDVCDIPAIVRWVKEGVGAGLQFEQLRAIVVWGLNRLVSDLRNATPET